MPRGVHCHRREDRGSPLLKMAHRSHPTDRLLTRAASMRRPTRVKS